MNSDSRYKINYPNVVAESFGNECVIVNLEKGTYFSLEALSTELWNAIVAATPMSVISAALLEKFPNSSDEISQDLRQFLNTLIEHDLLKVLTETLPVNSLDFQVQAYSKPTITVHSDLEDILLLDPVHDINEEGWPSGPTPN